MNLSQSFLTKCLSIVFLINVFIGNAFSQQAINKDASVKKYDAGYREYKLTDSSRRYKPGAKIGDSLFYRPVIIDVWYPAKISTNDAPLAYRYFLSLNEQRANILQDSIKYNGLADEYLRYFTAAKTASQQKAGVNLKTQSYLNVSGVKSRFPMIIYLSAYNGMSYENVPMFENVASHGYIVVSVSSIGRYPGNMTTKYPDVLEQVQDAGVTMRFIKDKNVNPSKIGVMGYSYGGLAGTLLTMKNRQIKAMLSLDGSEKYYYGFAKDEDKDFNELRQTQNLNMQTLSCPYAYLESDHKGDDGPADSIYQVPTRLGTKTYYTRLNNTIHEDFSCIANLGVYANTPYETVNKLVLAYFDQYLSDKGPVFDNAIAAVIKENKGADTFNPALIKSKNASGARITLKGRIITDDTNAPIPYASIGIPSGNTGTVADNDGNFSLLADGIAGDAVIRISSLGYQPKVFKVNELLSSLSRQQVIILSRQDTHLQEVVIKAKKIRIKAVGNTSRSKFFSVGLSLQDLGSEVGVRVSLGKKNTLLRSFNFSVSYNRLDTGTFRLNIYAVKNGIPAENLLNKNILVNIGHKAGDYKIDLMPYNLVFRGDIFVSLEWIDGKAAAAGGAVYFSAGLFSSSYNRKTTEANWVRVKGLGAGFNLQVEESD